MSARPDSGHPRVDRAPRAIELSTCVLGGPDVVWMAGPCAVEDEASLDACARAVAAAGAKVLRGGAFKPRTSPYRFPGLGRPGLALLRAAADRHGLAVVTECMDPREAEAVAEASDLVQIGSRSMQNYPLLREVGRCGVPALLKRGAGSTVDEWLFAAEHLFDAGAPAVALCERGVRGMPGPTRNVLDLGAVAHLLETARVPVVVDPSHAAGRADLVPRLARAAVAAGAHGLLVEVHPRPAEARSDADQAILPGTFADLVRDGRPGVVLPAGAR